MNFDIHHMRHALALAYRGLGQTAPNPTVGCVIVKDHQVIGCGTTAKGGRPHAEPIALAQAGSNAKGATLYVTLEPCNHHGKTPPCTDAIITAGIARVVIAATDPNPIAAGGAEKLRAAGIEVVTGVLEQEAKKLNVGFFSVLERKRPYVTLKLATSADHKIAPAKGGPRWITNDQSRAMGHLLRAQHDAILTGIGTALADDPLLTCRLPGLEDRSPIRILLDSYLRLPSGSQLIQTAPKVPTWLIHTDNQDRAIEYPGVTLLPVPATNNRPSLPAVLSLLATRGITRLLIEGGALVNSSFIENDLVDEIAWFKSPALLGENAKDAFTEPARHALTRYIPQESRPLGQDTLTIFIRR